MPSVLEWTFKLRDQVSDPARKASSGVDDFIQTMHSALAVVDYGIQGVRALGSALVAGIEPAMQRESTLNSFTTILGDATQAVNLYQEAVQFANRTPFETQDVVQSYKQLLAAQFRTEDLQIVATIVGDASALSEAPQQAMESVNRALRQIMSKDKLSQEELNQVAEAVPLNQSKFLANLSTLTGLSEQQTRAMKDAGQISGEQGVYAILKTLQDQFGGGMEKESKSVRGLWSTIKSMPTTYLERLQDTTGYDRLRGSLESVTRAFDPATERGEALGEFLQELGSGALERVSALIEYTAEGFASFFDGMRAGLGPLDDAFGPTNQANLEQFKTLMEGLGTGIGKVTTFVSALTTSLGDAWDYFYKIGEWWSENKTVADFLDKWVAPLTTSESTGGSGAGTTQAELVARERLRERYAVPAMASGGIVSSPTLALIGEGGEREAVVPESLWPSMLPALAGGGGAPSFVLNFNYTAGSGGSRDDAERIEGIVEGAMMQALERYAIQSGRRVA